MHQDIGPLQALMYEPSCLLEVLTDIKSLMILSRYIQEIWYLRTRMIDLYSFSSCQQGTDLKLCDK